MSSDLQELTKDELKDRARSAGVPVSGTKAELIERLESKRSGAGGDGSEADGDRAPGDTHADSSASSGIGSAGGAVNRARTVAQSMLGAPIETVVGVERNDDHWTVALQVLELTRVPRSSDVLAIYELRMDADDGELVGMTRSARGRRDQLGNR